MSKLILLLVLIGLAACADPNAMPLPTGEVHALNAGKWFPGPNDLTQPPVAR